MKLSNFFKASELSRDGEFLALGHVNTAHSQTLVYAESIHYIRQANQNSRVCGVITDPEHADRVDASKALVVSPRPRARFYQLHHEMIHRGLLEIQMTYGRGRNCHVHSTAIVSEKSHIGNNVVIGERAVIKDHVEIGDDTFVDAGAVIGNEGLLYYQQDGNNMFVKHAGGVRIGRGVVVLSQAVVVRGIHPASPTVIEDYAIIGIRTTIGHEAHVERNCVVAGDCVVARQARLKENAWVGTASVIREYVTVGSGARVMAGSVVVNDVPAGKAVSGNFAVDHNAHLMRYLKERKKKA